MREAAGLLLTTGRRVFLLLRSPEVRSPCTWAPPGGMVDDGETPWRAALREWVEEVGAPVPPLYDAMSVVSTTPTLRYTTFVCRVQPSTQVRPALQWESSGAGWFLESDLHKLTLHPGFEATLQAFPHLVFFSSS